MSDNGDHRQRNLAVVERAFAALGTGDVEQQFDAFTDDAVMELPYADPPVRLEGKDAIRAHVGPALNTFKFRLEITTVYECSDRDTLVLEYISDGHVTTTRKPYRNSYVGIVRFRDGLICFHREYYNPVPAARALAPD
jgi:ketosteroid isomerase-like protein